ncbi:MAG: S-adenosylmethionine synthetase N-terminal domain-containing protein, partial [Flavobacteriales bacterium]
METQELLLGTDDQRVHHFTSESVSEGHPDKVADTIADAILDAHIAQDPYARVACEVLCSSRHVTIAGEITSTATVDHKAIVRKVIRDIGYTDLSASFNADTVGITDRIIEQSLNIADGLLARGELGAGDQGLM